MCVCVCMRVCVCVHAGVLACMRMCLILFHCHCFRYQMSNSIASPICRSHPVAVFFLTFVQEQQDFLVANAPENLKVQSQAHDGELSPDSISGEVTGLKRFNFPGPKQTQVGLLRRGGASGVTSPGQLLLNTSASSASPRVRRPVLRSPIKFHSGRKNTGRVIVPPEVRFFLGRVLGFCGVVCVYLCVCLCVHK